MNNKLHSVTFSFFCDGDEYFVKGWAIGNKVLAISDYRCPVELPDDVMTSFCNNYRFVIMNSTWDNRFTHKTNDLISEKYIGVRGDYSAARAELRSEKFKNEMQDILDA